MIDFATACELLGVAEDEMHELLHQQPPGFPFPAVCRFERPRPDDLYPVMVIAWSDEQEAALRAYAARITKS